MRSLAAALLIALTAAPSLAQRDPGVALLEQAGWNALSAGRAHEAADAFRQAIAADPDNPRLYLGAATAAILERRDADARDALEHALTLNPEEGDAAYLLGQVLHRLGDLPGAIRTYEGLARLTRQPSTRLGPIPGISTGDAPTATMLDDDLARWRRELTLANRMQEAVGAHFTVSFNGPEDRALADRALASLDRAYWRIGSVLSTYPNEPIAVVLYTREQFRDITRSPRWAAGAYDGTIRVPMRGALGDPRELDRVVAHEFTHALVRTLAPRRIPTWLNEGLATALESNDLSWADQHVSAGAVPLSVLAGPFGRFGPGQAQVAYAVSALAVRRLLDRQGGFAVANLLRDLGAGEDFETAFARRMQLTFADFQASLR
ncbi:MAG: tetratricopeptide repeat protein [Betaproteobacteria bacterium]